MQLSLNFFILFFLNFTNFHLVIFFLIHRIMWLLMMALRTLLTCHMKNASGLYRSSLIGMVWFFSKEDLRAELPIGLFQSIRFQHLVYFMKMYLCAFLYAVVFLFDVCFYIFFSFSSRRMYSSKWMCRSCFNSTLFL